MTQIQKISITPSNSFLITDFLSRAGASLNSFRYFAKRPIEVINNHVCTLVFIKNNEPVCYGHLDKENDTVWLGVAVSENERGKGLGKKMMNDLIQIAKEKNISSVHLTVDISNKSAIKLYENFGFIKETTHETYIKYCLKLDE